MYAWSGGFLLTVFFWMSSFFMLFMKMSRINSFSPAVMSPFFAISARAPQNCLSHSLSRCFRFDNLCRSNVTFVFLTKAIARDSQNSIKEVCKTFTHGKFLSEDPFSFVSQC